MARFEIPEELGGGWVELRDHLSAVQKQRFDSAGVSFRGTPSVREVDLTQHFIGVVEVMLVAWSLPVPATREGIESDALAEEVGEWLWQRIEEQRAATVRSKSGA